MPNRLFKKFPGKKADSGKAPPGGSWNERTAAWPGVPGKTQGRPRDRSGTKKLRQGPREEGI